MNRSLIIIGVAASLCIGLAFVAGLATVMALHHFATDGMSGDSSGRGERRIALPQRERANPANPKEYQSYITLTVTDVDSFAIHGRKGSKTTLPSLLDSARRDLGLTSADDCRVVIRVRGSVSIGTVRKVILNCQNERFSEFELRDQRE